MRKFFLTTLIWLFTLFSLSFTCFAEEGGTQTAISEQLTSMVNPEQPILQAIPEQPILQSTSTIGYIYVGDSRYIGLDMYTGLSKIPNVWMVAKVAKGYGWLKSSAQSQVDSIEASNPQITRWYEVYTLGINDPGNMGKYAEWYLQRALSGHNVVLVSVNPIERHKSITNELISGFNQTIASTGLPYIDSYSYLIDKGYKTADGVHFDKKTNQLINCYVTIMLKSYAGDL